MHHEHRGQHQCRADARAGQIVAIDLADAVRVQHEAQADKHAGEEEERQQAGVIAGDIPDLRDPGGGILQLQRVERIGCSEVEAERRRGHQQCRQHREQCRAMARERVAEQRQDHAAEREPHHHDGDDPVAIFRPLRDREVAGQRRLVSNRGQRHEEQGHERACGGCCDAHGGHGVRWVSLRSTHPMMFPVCPTEPITSFMATRSGPGSPRAMC